MQDLTNLYLDSNRIPEVDRLMVAGPVKLQQLILSHNRVERISDGAFYRLRQLHTLALDFNLIREITPHTFAGLDRLIKLVLHDNRIPTVLNDTFVQSPLLEQLWLYNNELSCLEADTFKGLVNLQILHLSSNRLSYLPEEIFQNCRSIVYLLLSANRLSSITTRPFKNLRNLTQLALSYNPIVYVGEGTFASTDSLFYLQWHEAGSSSLRCDCSALWLYQWISSRRLQTSVLCNEPAQFNGQDIRVLQEASFGCNSVVLKVNVNEDCDNHLVVVDGCLRLTCTSAPRTEVTWSRADGEPIRSVQHSCDAQSSCAVGAGSEGVLVVEMVTEYDAGDYICTASFLNKTVVKICRVSIGEPPNLIEAPNDVYLVNPGPPAKFSMDFSGKPYPTVQWYHIREGGGEVALRETGLTSRYVVSSDGTLVILDTQLGDVGTYRAVISNSLGQVTVEATLEVYYELPCRRGCANGGTCYSIPICYCTDNYEGKECENYIGPPTGTPPPDDSSGDYTYFSSGDLDQYSQYDDDEDLQAVRKKKRSVIQVPDKGGVRQHHGRRGEDTAKLKLKEMVKEELAFNFKLEQARGFAKSKKQKSAHPVVVSSTEESSQTSHPVQPMGEIPSTSHVTSDPSQDHSPLIYHGNPSPMPTREQFRA